MLDAYCELASFVSGQRERTRGHGRLHGGAAEALRLVRVVESASRGLSATFFPAQRRSVGMPATHKFWAVRTRLYRRLSQ